ncbi:MAG: AAA family ATPase [Rhodobacteraceae bacterium]|nr:AAA family ATPase [Paracoccaceae bacterium]
MTKSVLIIAPERSVSDAIAAALANDPGMQIERQTSTLAGMNGHAVEMAGNFDMVLFQTAPDDAEALAAIRKLAGARSPGTRLVALADGAISLSEARILMDAGVDEVLPLPGTAGRTTRPGTAQGRAEPTKVGQVIAVAQARGGIGATTVAVNLADQLARGAGLGRKDARPRVAIVDLDLQFGTVGSALDLEEQDTLEQIALDGTIPDALFLAQSMPRIASGVSVLPAPSRFVPLDSLRPEQVAAIFDELRRTHDFVVVDLPRALVGWIEPVIARADQLVVVTDIAVPSIRHARRLIDFFTQDHLTLPVEIVVNHESKPYFGSAMQKEAARVLERPLAHWLPDDPRAAAAATGRGKTLAEIAPRSPLAKATAKLAAETRARLGAAPRPASH